MNRRPPKDLAVSIRGRLLARSRQTGEDFQFLLQRYASERFLYRLGISPHRDRYVLKGAMLFALWGGSLYRGTRDLDLTGYGSSETDAVIAAMQEICTLPVATDGLSYDGASVAAEPIRDTAEYNALRVRLNAALAGARIPMQIDIGFGNAVEPPATEADYPTLLDMPAPRIRAYPHEAVVAEKFHAMTCSARSIAVTRIFTTSMFWLASSPLMESVSPARLPRLSSAVAPRSTRRCPSP